MDWSASPTRDSEAGSHRGVSPGRSGGKERGTTRDQFPDQDVLRVVGVLVLVHQHLPEPAAVLLGHLGQGLEEVDRDHDQVVEVHRAGRDQPALVFGVGLGQGLLPGGLRAGGERLVVDQLVLQVRHLGGHRLRRVLLGVELELAAGERHQPLRVGLVVDGERGRVAEPFRLPAQDAHAGRMERHDPHGPRLRADQRGDAGGHLAGRLVGEGDGQDLVRRDVARGEQVRDPVGEHPGLPRARAGHDEQRAALVYHGSTLLRIESVEEGIYREGGHVNRVGGRADKSSGRGAPRPRHRE
jgi:hypothetical protein